MNTALRQRLAVLVAAGVLFVVILPLALLSLGRRLNGVLGWPALLYPPVNGIIVMKKSGVLTVALAAIGTALVWLPIVMTVALSVAASLAARTHRRRAGADARPAGRRSGDRHTLTGLASGETEPTGWPWDLILTTIAGYTLTLVELGIGGVLLVRNLFRRSRSASRDS